LIDILIDDDGDYNYDNQIDLKHLKQTNYWNMSLSWSLCWICCRRKEMTTWDNNFWLDLDYLQVSRAAQYCSAHFSTVLFAEIWCDVQR